MRILAGVVTHNRKALLERCVRALEEQSRPLDEIVVIDNASTDGTREMLTAHRVTVVSQANVGSAGGWHRAIEFALGGGFDAVWLMDDDGFPATDALERLERALTPETACVSSAVVDEAEPATLVFPLPRLNSRGFPAIVGLPRKYATVRIAGAVAPQGVYPFAHLFNGALIPTRVIRNVGNVERDYFLFGDELDYLYRLRTAGTVCTILSATHLHPDVSGRALSELKVYYYIKNTLILNRRYLDHAVVRSTLTVLIALARVGRRNGWRTALSYLFGSRRQVLRKAVLRGVRGHVGRDHDA